MKPQHLTFADAIIAGTGPLDAYLQAGYKTSNRTFASIAAQRLLKRPDISEYIAGGRQVAQVTAEWKREAMLQTLREIAESPDTPAAARTGAITQASKMLGLDAPAQVEHSNEVVIKWMS